MQSISKYNKIHVKFQKHAKIWDCLWKQLMEIYFQICIKCTWEKQEALASVAQLLECPLSHTRTDWGFKSWSGPIWEATNWCFSHQCFLSLSLPLYLKSIYIKKEKQQNNILLLYEEGQIRKKPGSFVRNNASIFPLKNLKWIWC